jgi:hypothetical protein
MIITNNLYIINEKLEPTYPYHLPLSSTIYITFKPTRYNKGEICNGASAESKKIKHNKVDSDENLGSVNSFDLNFKNFFNNKRLKFNHS